MQGCRSTLMTSSTEYCVAFGWVVWASPDKPSKCSVSALASKPMPIYLRFGNFQMIERGDPPHIGFHFWSLHAPWTKSACNMPLHLGCGVKERVARHVHSQNQNINTQCTRHWRCKRSLQANNAFLQVNICYSNEPCCFGNAVFCTKLKAFFGFRRPGPTAQNLANKSILCMFVAQTHANMNLIDFLRCCFAPPSNWNVFNQAWISLIQFPQNATKIVNLKCFQINFVNFDQSFSTFESILVDLISSLPPPPNLYQFKSTWIHFESTLTDLQVFRHMCDAKNRCNVLTASDAEKKNNAQLCDMTIFWHPNRQITILIQFLYPNTRKPPFGSNFCDVMTFLWFLTQKRLRGQFCRKEGFLWSGSVES